jgi:hypothetical protein
VTGKARPVSTYEAHDGAYRLVRPFLWVAVAGFALGFSVFLAIGAGAVARDHDRWTQPSGLFAEAARQS